MARRDRPLPAPRSSGGRDLMIRRDGRARRRTGRRTRSAPSRRRTRRTGCRPGLGGSPATVRQPSSASRSSVSTAAATIPRACSSATPVSGPARVAPATSAETSDAARAARIAPREASVAVSAERSTSATWPAWTAAAASRYGHRADPSVVAGGSTKPSGCPSKRARRTVTSAIARAPGVDSSVSHGVSAPTTMASAASPSPRASITPSSWRASARPARVAGSEGTPDDRSGATTSGPGPIRMAVPARAASRFAKAWSDSARSGSTALATISAIASEAIRSIRSNAATTAPSGAPSAGAEVARRT